MAQHGKKYLEVAKLVDRTKLYSPTEASELLKQTSFVKFDPTRTIKEVRSGRVEFRVDRSGLIHVPAGKLSFDEPSILDNVAAMIEAVVAAKPSGAKGHYVRSITLTTSMGPGIRLDTVAAV